MEQHLLVKWNSTDDGSKVAYSISEGGSDWRKVIVMDAVTKEIIGDTLERY